MLAPYKYILAYVMITWCIDRLYQFAYRVIKPSTTCSSIDWQIVRIIFKMAIHLLFKHTYTCSPMCVQYIRLKALTVHSISAGSKTSFYQFSDWAGSSQIHNVIKHQQLRCILYNSGIVWPQPDKRIPQFASKSEQPGVYWDSPITIMVTGSAARIIRQIIHSTVGQEGGGRRERQRKWKGGRRRKNRFIPILGIASVYVYMYLLHTTGITALVCTCVVVRGWSTTCKNSTSLSHTCGL